MAVFLATRFFAEEQFIFFYNNRYLVTSVSYWICIFHLINNALDNKDDIFLQKKKIWCRNLKKQNTTKQMRAISDSFKE